MKKETKDYFPSIHYDQRFLVRNCIDTAKYMLATDKVLIINKNSIIEFKDHNYVKKNLLLKK